MPLQRRLPKRGFKKRNQLVYQVVNVEDLERVQPGDVIDATVLAASGLVKDPKKPVKVLTSINLHGHRFLTFLTGRKPTGLDSLRRWSRPIMKGDKQVASSEHPLATESLHLPHLAVGLTVGKELR